MPAPFITFEGGEGAGKSTQIKLTSEWLQLRNIPHIVTREPGGSEGAEEIRQLLVTGRAGRWDAFSECLLHLAARHDHVRRTVIPALRKGVWVLCDRFSDSTFAYQGYGYGMPLDMIDQLNHQATGGLKPDLTFLLDLPVEVGLKRAAQRKIASGLEADRYETMAAAFHERIRDGFLALARNEPQRFLKIDTGQDSMTIQRIIQEIIHNQFLTK